MNQNDKSALPNIFSEIIYDDAPAAIEWLARAFGFVKGEIIDGPNGTIAHADMHYRTGTIMPKCRIPDDCIDTRRYPLFMARDVMRRAIDLIKAKIQGSQAQ